MYKKSLTRNHLVKALVLSFFAMVILDFSSCTGDPPTPGPIADLVLYLEAGYLDFCDSSVADESDVEIMVAVDQVNSDGTFENVYFEVYDVNNDSSQGNPADLEYDVEVPESGIFVVSVTVEVDCNSCCSAYSECNGTGEGGNGHPFYRGMSGQYNADAPPSLIELAPLFTQCIRCGC